MRIQHILLFLAILVISLGKHSKKEEDSSNDNEGHHSGRRQTHRHPVKTQRLHLISVMGGPGSGKGTQCKFLNSKFGFVHISLGDLFRRQRDNGTPLSKQIGAYIEAGQFVPSAIGVKLLTQELDKIDDGQTVLLDGFPRNQDNIQVWQQVNGKKYKINNFLYFTCPDEIVKQRLLERAKIEGRIDDKEETINERISLFHKETDPIIQARQRSTTCKFTKVDTNRSQEQVQKELQRIFQRQGYQPVEQTQQL